MEFSFISGEKHWLKLPSKPHLAPLSAGKATAPSVAVSPDPDQAFLQEPFQTHLVHGFLHISGPETFIQLPQTCVLGKQFCLNT